ARGRRWQLVLAGRVMAAAVIVALGVSVMRLRDLLDQAYLQIHQMRGVGAFVTSPDVSVVSLWGGTASLGAHAKLAYDRGTGRFVILSSDLAPPPEGHRYQLWVFSEGIQPVAAFSLDVTEGVLRGRPRGDAPFLFAVSLESAAAADDPAGPIVLRSGLLRDTR
ncbi:MAG: anti-sigma factor domain-containing protein, partial [Candidatus Rokuibacteriota bacterium]